GAAHFLDELPELPELPGAAHDVHVRGAAEDLLLVLLGHAAQNADDLRRVPLLVGAQTAERAVDLLLGVLADRAGVEEDHVGVAGVVNQLIPLAAQAPHHQLAVEHVHLAADRLDVEFFAHAPFTICSISTFQHSGRGARVAPFAPFARFAAF